MNIEELKLELDILKTAAKKILSITDYTQNHDLSNVTYDPYNADDRMYMDEFHSVFTHIDYIYSALTYFQNPIIEEAILKNLGGGKHKFNDIELHVNDIVEIYDFDESLKLWYWRPVILRPHSNYHGKRSRIRVCKSK